MILRYEDFERILEEMRPGAGRYDWLVALLRWSAKRGPRLHKYAHSIAKRPRDPSKPYFIFESGGLLLFGDRQDRYSRWVASEPTCEDSSVARIAESLNERSGAYLDVGTNMGVVAALVAKVCPDRAVIAVEPNPVTARRAACTFALNGLRNVTLVCAAVGESCGEATFYAAPGNSDAASLSAATVGGDPNHIKVPVVTIDELVAKTGVGDVAFIKIDVEGFEPQAIAGAKETIRKDRPDLFYEYHWDIAPKLGWTAETVSDQISDLGRYRFSVLHGDEPIREFPPTREMGLNVNVWCRRA